MSKPEATLLRPLQNLAKLLLFGTNCQFVFILVLTDTFASTQREKRMQLCELLHNRVIPVSSATNSTQAHLERNQVATSSDALVERK
jgi:hypothetical protein